EILKALSEHSAAGARRAMHRHIRRVEREFAQNVGPEGADAKGGASEISDVGASDPEPRRDGGEGRFQ
ncbi:MAG: hypothetical protein QOI66_1985, partial [Myxococcales bacterium]|nr:hypothetical protein [Myxococcales bacterium]